MSAEHAAPSVTRGPKSLAELRAQYPYVAATKVHWGDMDALGHVNNAVYFKYLENTRLTMMESLGLLPRLFDDERAGLVLADARCRYKAPVAYPDTLHIALRVELTSEDRMRFQYALFSERLQRVAAEAETIQVCVSPQTGRKIAMPTWFRESLSRLS